MGYFGVNKVVSLFPRRVGREKGIRAQNVLSRFSQCVHVNRAAIARPSRKHPVTNDCQNITTTKHNTIVFAKPVEFDPNTTKALTKYIRLIASAIASSNVSSFKNTLQKQ
jgi:hypothetical protein